MAENAVAKLQIRESILSKESEVCMVDSLVKLANSYHVIAASLEQSTYAQDSEVPPPVVGIAPGM